MLFDAVKQTLSQADTVEQVLDSYKNCFDIVDEYAKYLADGTLQTKDQLLEAQTKLTGVYASLITVQKMAEAMKRNIESIMFIQKCEEIEKATGKAAVMSKVEREVSAAVAPWRNVRNIFEGYVLAADKAIFSCQNAIKYMFKDEYYSNNNPESKF